MFDFTFHSIAKHDRAETYSYITPYCTIAFAISGCKWLKYAGKELDNPGPFISMLPAGTFLEFEYSSERINWAILLDTDSLTLTDDADIVQIEYEGRYLQIASFVPIIAEHVAGWEGEFIRIYNAFKSPTPVNQLRCKLGVYNILRFILDRQLDSFFGSPAEKLRWLIDEDIEMANSLEKLGEQCGYSVDHLRIIFRNHYGLNPQAYRNRARMAHAMEMVSNTDLSVKEISTKTGFPHVSHFSRMYKKTFGITPSEGIKRFRSFSGS